MRTPAHKTMIAFWREVTTSEGGCWRWKGARAADGAPIFSFGGTTVSAARFLFEAMVGRVPAGHRIVPDCGDPLCVNTEHAMPRRDSESRGVTARDSEAA